ncbi:DUF1003 domain-containing protein [Candidatus Gracilibacteria bacterium]|nr:DUF1003 domain-containing protein [Candidatus Gracilibacteria bacterium]
MPKMAEGKREAAIEKREKTTKMDRFALFITEKVGTIGFFLIIFLWTILWLSWNTFAPLGLRFDAYPGFVLWLFISNVIQLILMPLIMVGQNLQGKHAEARSESDFEFNIKGKLQIQKQLNEVLEQNRDIMQQLREINKKISPKGTVNYRQCSDTGLQSSTHALNPPFNPMMFRIYIARFFSSLLLR